MQHGSHQTSEQVQEGGGGWMGRYENMLRKIQPPMNTNGILSRSQNFSSRDVTHCRLGGIPEPRASSGTQNAPRRAPVGGGVLRSREPSSWRIIPYFPLKIMEYLRFPHSVLQVYAPPLLFATVTPSASLSNLPTAREDKFPSVPLGASVAVMNGRAPSIFAYATRATAEYVQLQPIVANTAEELHCRLPCYQIIFRRKQYKNVYLACGV